MKNQLTNVEAKLTLCENASASKDGNTARAEGVRTRPFWLGGSSLLCQKGSLIMKKNKSQIESKLHRQSPGMFIPITIAALTVLAWSAVTSAELGHATKTNHNAGNRVLSCQQVIMLESLGTLLGINR
jgi:hypothetical protein